MKLSNKAAKRIASLINSIQVSHLMIEDAGDSKIGIEMWRYRQAEVTVALHEEFGINLPNLDFCKARLVNPYK